MLNVIFSFLLFFYSLNSNAIMGGELVNANQAIARVTVSLSLVGASSDQRGYCSAVLISNHAAITAAHCVVDKSPASVLITFGTVASQATQFRVLNNIIIPHEYHPYGDQLPNMKNAFDIAILLFDGGLPDGFQVAQMQSGNPLLAKNVIHIAGFGITSAEATNGGVLRTCVTQVLDPHYSESEIELLASHECSPATGDSGGPVFTVNSGVVSFYAIHNWGWHDAAQNPTIGVHTRIGFYYPWINSFL